MPGHRRRRPANRRLRRRLAERDETPEPILQDRQIINPNMKINEGRNKIESAGRSLILTGAGISAESGVPTFRGGADTWKGMPFHELSSARMVNDDLPLVWEWFDYRRGVIAECRPN